jgi:hypothetical protein
MEKRNGEEGHHPIIKEIETHRSLYHGQVSLYILCSDPAHYFAHDRFRRFGKAGRVYREERA